MTEAGRNDRSIQEFATVDWMAYQGAPDGGVAGKSRITQWWTGSLCKEVNLPQAIIYSVSILYKWGRSLLGLRRDEKSCHPP